MERINLIAQQKIDDFAEHPTSIAMDALIAQFRQPALSDDCVARLAMRLAHSGEILNHQISGIFADVPSTGGPSSLSTLLCPLELAAAGAIVPKLGVPGRPAGGIDVLACIPGFNAALDPSQVKACLRNCGYAHFLAGNHFAPLDAVFFSYRQKAGAQDIATLAIASLLSKKIAVGVKNVALDIRVAPFTNFGTWELARANGRRFISIAAQLGITAVCMLTDSTIPYQGLIGRGESLIALSAILKGTANEDLISHMRLCRQMSEACLGREINASPQQLLQVFCENLEQQGTTWEKFEAKVHHVESQPRATLEATTDGWLAVNLDSVREILTTHQARYKTADVPFPDPCGIELTVRPGSPVHRGQVIAQVRAVGDLDLITAELRRHIYESDRPITRRVPETIA